MFADLAYAAGYHASLTLRVIMPRLRRGLSCLTYAAGYHASLTLRVVMLRLRCGLSFCANI